MYSLGLIRGLPDLRCLHVRTRIRKLIKGCAEVQLNILSAEESIQLLLETGEVQRSDSALDAAGQIARACEYLRAFPILYVGG